MSMSSSSNSLVYSSDGGGYSTHDALLLMGIGFGAIVFSVLVIVLCECLCCRPRRGNTIVYVAARPFFEHHGRASGLNPSSVATLPSFKYQRGIGSASDGSSSGRGWAQCVVCLSLVQEGEIVRQLPACKHLFHVGCIDMWLCSHSTCPLCRATVEAIKEAPAKDQTPPV